MVKGSSQFSNGNYKFVIFNRQSSISHSTLNIQHVTSNIQLINSYPIKYLTFP